MERASGVIAEEGEGLVRAAIGLILLYAACGSRDPSPEPVPIPEPRLAYVDSTARYNVATAIATAACSQHDAGARLGGGCDVNGGTAQTSAAFGDDGWMCVVIIDDTRVGAIITVRLICEAP
jgi:hypothetical protein